MVLPEQYSASKSGAFPHIASNIPRPSQTIYTEELLDKPSVNRIGIEEDEDCGDLDLSLDAYAWEAGYDKTWEELKEADGRLIVSERGSTLRDVETASEPFDGEQLSVPTRKGALRDVVILLDVSDAMRETDYKPNRLHCTLTVLEEFLPVFFQSNPLSRVALVAMIHGQAIPVSPLSGSLGEQVELLAELRERDIAGGSVSLLNGLQRCAALLMASAPYSTREIVIIFGSINTCDSGHIDSLLKELKSKGIQTTIIALTPEVYVLRKMARITGGQYTIARSLDEYRAALFNLQKAPNWNPLTETRLVPIGFPRRMQTTIATLCVCHNRPSLKGYLCPRCRGKVCEIPTKCRICDLHIASSVDVAKTTQQYAPLPKHRLLSEGQYRCDMCSVAFPVNGYECVSCNTVFCSDCDEFRITVLQQCPTCCVPNRKQLSVVGLKIPAT